MRGLQFVLASIVTLAAIHSAPAATIVGFAPGVEASPAGLTPNQINALKATGFNTLVLFSITITTNGDFYYGGGGGPNILLCTGGSYVGPANWGALLGQCKTSPSAINRIEMCIGGWLDQSFLNIKNLIASNGTGSGTVLYRNLAALKAVLGLAAMDYDDEYEYDSGSAIAFGQMCGSVGMKVTLCPYTASSFWKSVKSGLGGTVDYVYLQCYAGGAGNDAASWSSALSVPISQVLPGDWDSDSDLAFLNLMRVGKSEGCIGGWHWPSAANGTSAAATIKLYAALIQSAYGTNVYWQGGTSDFNVPASWTGGIVPGVSANAVNDSGSNNVTQIFPGDSAWSANCLWAGDATNATGAYLQTGSTVTAVNPGSWLRLGDCPGAAGYYTLNAGTLNLSNNLTVVGESGAGVLNINSASASLGDVILGLNSGSTGVLILNGATLNVRGISAGSGTNTVNILAGGVTIDSQGFDAVASPIMAGAGRLTKIGAGTLTLTGRSTFTGPTIINGGTLETKTGANDGRLDFTSSLTINDGATVLVTGDNALFGFGNYVIPVTNNAGGTLTIASNHTAHIKGAIYLNGGTIDSADAGPNPYGTWNLDQGKITTLGGPVSSTISAKNVLLATPTLFNIPAGATNGIDLNVSGYFYAGEIVKSGTGVMQLSGTNTYTGGTIISAGKLQLGDGVSRIGVVTNDITDNSTLIFANPWDQSYSNVITGSGVVVKNGAGKLTLSRICTYAGSTTIGSGTLALVGSGSIASSGLITVSNGTILDVTGRVDQTLTINSGKSLRGSGTILGKLAAAVGSTINPGDAIGTLIVQSNITLAGTLSMEINRTNSQTADQLASGSGSITGGGSLVVFNSGPPPQSGDVFHLFNVPVTGFSSVSLPSLPSNCAWTNTLAIDGTIQVVTFVSTTLTNITMQICGNMLTLAWPTDHTGWRLQAQTNSAGAGLNANWFDVADSTNVNQVTMPIDPANGSVFFRLIYP